MKTIIKLLFAVALLAATASCTNKWHSCPTYGNATPSWKQLDVKAIAKEAARKTDAELLCKR